MRRTNRNLLVVTPTAPNLEIAVADAVATMNAFLNEGKNVLVHCHDGRSRTGLILKAWKMKKEGWTGAAGEQMAHVWLAKNWLPYQDTHFQNFLTASNQFKVRGVSQYRQIIIIAAVSRAQYLYIASIN